MALVEEGIQHYFDTALPTQKPERVAGMILEFEKEGCVEVRPFKKDGRSTK